MGKELCFLDDSKKGLDEREGSGEIICLLPRDAPWVSG